MTAQRSGRPWRRIKARVVRRDAGICHLCGKPGADSADHVIPAAHGGTNAMSNLKAVHHDVYPNCNRIRGDRPVDEVREEMRGHSTEGGWDW